MKSKRASAPAAPGPLRWSYREYSIHDRPSPTGRRFEVRSPNDELVLYCRLRRSEPRLVFFADEKETSELFRLEPRPVRQFQRAYDVVDSLSGTVFGQIRKRVYEDLKKSEWFILNPEGEQLGLVTETAPEPSLLRRIVPMDRLFSKAWALHWGQSIAGVIHPRASLVGDKLEVNLKFDARDEIDRRLALGTAVAMRADPHQGSNSNSD